MTRYLKLPIRDYRIFLVLSAVLIFIPNASARENFQTYRRMNVVGTVEEVNAEISRLYIIEEGTSERWDFFVHPNILKDFKKGDYVRVYFGSLKLPAISVKKMTPLEYQAQGQNKGYLYKGKKELSK